MLKHENNFKETNLYFVLHSKTFKNHPYNKTSDKIIPKMNSEEDNKCRIYHGRLKSFVIAVIFSTVVDIPGQNRFCLVMQYILSIIFDLDTTAHISGSMYSEMEECSGLV